MRVRTLSRQVLTNVTASLSASLLCLCIGAVAQAAAPVTQSQGHDRTEQLPDRPMAAPPSTDDGGAAPAAPRPTGVVFEVQDLHQQVQELRGQLEELNHRVARMEADQKARYQDVDKRLQSGASAGPGDTTPDAAPATSEPAGGVGESTSERLAYAKGVQQIHAKHYQQAIESFNQQLNDFPGGSFEANAFYWLGEAYLALPDPQFERARQSFAQVVNLYPENAKVPDALYKLGVVYDKLGDAAKAREYMRRVREQHPGTTAAGLADTFLSQKH